jgi:hypothetical protein
VWLVVVVIDPIGLGFGLEDCLLCPALKILVDGCCNRLKCGGYVIEWDSAEGVVYSCAFGVLIVEVGLVRLMGIHVEG